MGRKDCFKSTFGTSFHAKYWLSLNQAGLFCASLSVSIHIFSLCTIKNNLTQNSIATQIIFGVLYVPAATMALANLFMAWSTNPGAVPLGARPIPVGNNEDEENDLAPLKKTKRSRASTRGIRRCRKCNNNFKPPRSHHDSVTGRCIVKMDHFCPWVGNAVGALNHKFFFLFIFYTLCTSLISLILLTMRFVRCSSYRALEDDTDNAESLGIYSNKGCNDRKLYSPQVLVLITVSIIFLIFTCCMIFEQIDAIKSNTSKIARMKISMGEGTEEFERVTSDFNEMFGGTSPNVALHWFLPTKVRFPDNSSMMKVMGYEYKKEWDGKIFKKQSDLESATDSTSSLDRSLVISDCQEDEEEFVGGGNNVKRERDLETLLPENEGIHIHSMNIEDIKQRGNMKKA